MKKLLTLNFLLIFSLMAFSQNGKIQVQAEPGIMIMFDGEEYGVTTPELNGLVIDDVTPGWHSINAIKPGYRTRKGSIYLEPRDIKFYKVEKLLPEVVVSESGGSNAGDIGAGVGNLQIQSIPAAIRVLVPEFEIDYTKSQDKMLLQDIPAGHILVQFEWNNIRLSHSFDILGSQQTNVMVDMTNGSGEIEKILFSEIINLNEPSGINTTPMSNAYRRETAYNAGQQPQETIEVQGEQYTQMAEVQNLGTYATGNQGGNESTESPNISVSGLDTRLVVGNLPEPNIADCRVTRENTVTVEIVVNREGNVVAASVRDATYQDRCIWNQVKQAAFETKFSADPNASNSEKGLITYKILP
jgi:hypothetical protein